MIYLSEPDRFSATTVDQAQSLRSLAYGVADELKPRPEITRLWLVAGGKGGVGTTTVAWNIALASSRGGRRTMLLDADPRGDDAAWLVKLDPHHTLADLLTGKLDRQENLNYPENDNLLFIGGTPGWQQLYGGQRAALNRLFALIGNPRLSMDVAVIDAGNGSLDLPLAAQKYAEKLILVTTSETPAVVNTFRTLKILAAVESDLPCRYCLVVNQAGYRAARRTFQRLAGAARRLLGLELSLWGWMAKSSQPLKLTIRWLSADNKRKVVVAKEMSNWIKFTNFFDFLLPSR